MSYQSKDSLVQDRQLKVQRLVIPFTVTSSATPSSVLLRSDEPAILFLRSEGVDQITAALSDGETATYSSPADDSDGILNIFIKVQESVSKVCRASCVLRPSGASHPVGLGDSDGLSSDSNIMLTLDSSVDFSTTSADACLEVEYVVAD